MVTTGNLQHATGVFATQLQAERALKALQSANFPMQQVSVVAKQGDDHEALSGVEVKETVGSHAGEAAKDGAIVGGLGGAVLGAAEVLGASTLLALLPGAGQVILFGSVAANALATAVVGGIAGAAGGGLIGGLLGWGVPEKQAKLYQSRIIDGQYLVMVEGTEAQVKKAANILNPNGLQEWHVYEMTRS